MAKMKLADQVALVERFLNENFAFRYNEVRDTFEFKVLNPEMGGSLTNTDFVPLQDEALNSIILEAMKAGIEGKVTDLVKRIIYSEATESFNPLLSYLKGLPIWDGKDRVNEVISSIPSVDDEKGHFVRIWFRSVVAHWLCMESIYGNQLVVMFIGDQGCGKGSFIKKLLPEQLQMYYLDHINLVNKHDTDMALANCGLVTFVATTNETRPLKDKTGTRRFIVINVPSGSQMPNLEIDYDQFYAQLVYEVCEQKEVYWLNQEENRRLQILNKDYCEVDDFSTMISTCFRKPEEGEEGCEMLSVDILRVVQMRYPGVKIDHRTRSILGANLSSMGIKSHRTNKGYCYTVVQIAA